MKFLLYILGGLKPAAPTPPRLGSGALTFPGGFPMLREKFGPPHQCSVPSVETARAFGADYGALWRCDCGKQYRLIYATAGQRAGSDAFQPLSETQVA